MKKKHVYISLLAALSIIIHGFEFMIPAVTPWFKLGLSNSVSLAVLVVFGLKEAIMVTSLRIFISSFIFGTFLSPAFLLSFAGGMTSILMMGFFYKRFTPYLSVLGVSLIGAYFHILAQGAVLKFVLIKHNGIFFLIPAMLLVSLVTGLINGNISLRLCEHLDRVEVKNG